jgi:hypothetical protein
VAVYLGQKASRWVHPWRDGAGFQRFEDFLSSRRNESGSPVDVLGIVVAAGEESWPEGAVEI